MRRNLNPSRAKTSRQSRIRIRPSDISDVKFIDQLGSFIFLDDLIEGNLVVVDIGQYISRQFALIT